MAITLTPSLGLPQWGQGADSPSRTAFDALLAAIDAYTVVDDRTNPAALPTTGVNGMGLADGRYAHVVNGTYRQLYRRAQGAWTQVGGNTWDQTTYSRAAVGLDAAAAARVVSHPSLAIAGLTENWDGSSTRGGRQAIGDLNAAQPGAIHVGDTATAVALATRGRVWVKAAAASERAVVATAGVATAGNLFTAVDSTGAEPWTIDGSGRMRSQAATAFGGAALTTGVPFASAPGGADTTAADLYAATGKFASRWWRALGDTTPIASISDTAIVLGRNPWTGGTVSILAPLTVSATMAVTGAAALQAGLTVTGGTTALAATTVGGTLGVAGATTLAGLNAGTTGLGATTASSLAVTGGASIAGNATVGGTFGVTGATTLAGLAAGTTSVGALTAASAQINGAVAATGALSGSSLTVTGALSAHGGLVASAASGSGAELRTRPPTQYSGTAVQSVRASTVAVRSVSPATILGAAEQTVDVAFTMAEDGWLRLDAQIYLNCGTGNSNTTEDTTSQFSFELRSASASIETGYTHMLTQTVDDTTRQVTARNDFTLFDLFNTRLTAGSYTLRVHYLKLTTLATTFERGVFLFTPCVLHSTS